MIFDVIRLIVRCISWASPYKWIDYPFKKSQKTAEKNEDFEKAEKIKKRRYLISEIYIIGWLGLSFFFLFIHEWIPLVVSVIFLARVVLILNKEVDVVLFESNKITDGNEVSHFARVVILAFVNYLSATMIFALVYSKVGTYQIENGVVVSPLPIQNAIAQGLSIMLTLSPTYDAVNTGTTFLTLAQSGFSFLFGILILTTFINLIRLKSNTDHK